MRTFSLDGKSIGNGKKTFIIAEIGLAHDGSLGMAHSYVDAVADAGADAIKFQTHIAEAESTSNEQFRINFSYEDATRFDYWKRTGFTFEQWDGLFAHAQERGLTFLSTPFSTTAVHWLDKIGVRGWKVGSGDLGNWELAEALAHTGKPVIFSTGMSSWDEIEDVIAFCTERKMDMALLQCTSKYPAPLKDVGLNVIDRLQNDFGIISGLSDHSGTVFPSLAVMARGVAIVEFHVVFDKRMFGLDTKASLTLDELAFVVEARNAFHSMGSEVDKNTTAQEMGKMRKLFGRSLALRHDLAKGAILTEEDLCLKKPGSGIPHKELVNLIGKPLTRAVPASRLLCIEDIGNEYE
ncbi:N-acetylneuraminate synthase family protein [Pseudodesulfovibrio piezophilus]|uniref:N-acetylneuraminate synthase n=1 Tax=Pseudodesulfovibrio piezophilus (strain DSM 21447 / JCM 15486 / C1TLV30) TaxID=1322246 RepID=M1WXT9_PSEP2|nr:N-acetylneuraminate synthase family protein [Pseudodesulfovibrio piezophilus]CCH49913.1 N-acetylneuraminate synthase [Pseudodesulfovibrio piezophilus C1TLV30]